MIRLSYINNNSSNSSLFISNHSKSTLLIIDSIISKNNGTNELIHLSLGTFQIINTIVSYNIYNCKNLITIENYDENGLFSLFLQNCSFHHNICNKFLYISVIILNIFFSNSILEKNCFNEELMTITFIESNLGLEFKNLTMIGQTHGFYLINLKSSSFSKTFLCIDYLIAAYGNKDQNFGKSVFKISGVFQTTVNFLKILNYYSLNEVSGLSISDDQNNQNNQYISFILNNTLIQNNEAQYEDESSPGGVGILFENLDSFYILNSYFINNLINSDNNSINVGSPCFLNQNSMAYLYINNSFFINNTAPTQSSCITMVGDNLTIENSIFQGNILNNISDSNSNGALYFDCILIYLSNTTFYNNYGFISTFSIASNKEIVYIFIENIKIINNIASFSIFDISVLCYKISFVNAIVLNNYSDNYFFMMSNIGEDIENHSFYFTNITYFNNSHKIGFLLINIGAQYTFTQCFYYQNKGLIFSMISEITTTCEILKTVFLKSINEQNFIFSILLGKFSLDNCTISENFEGKCKKTLYFFFT